MDYENSLIIAYKILDKLKTFNPHKDEMAREIANELEIAFEHGIEWTKELEGIGQYA